MSIGEWQVLLLIAGIGGFFVLFIWLVENYASKQKSWKEETDEIMWRAVK